MIFRTAALLAGLVAGVAAQTTANCNPLYGTCPPDPALGGSIEVDFTQGSSDRIDPVYSADEISYDSNMGMQMTINKLGDGPTVASDFYIFFGKVEIEAQCAPGTGIVSSVVLISDDNDEIDLEWIGTDDFHVQTNYFSKGQVGTYNRGGMTDVANPATTFHTYTIDWTRESITWYVDGAVARVLTSDTPEGYPQSPMQIKIGSWVGGDPNNEPGTIAWAGGLTDFSQAPFNFYIRSLKVTDYSTGSGYVYTDNSGSEDSIQVVSGSVGGFSTFDAATSTSAETATSTSSVESTTSTAESSTTLTSSSTAPTTAPTTSSTTSSSSTEDSSTSIASTSSSASSSIVSTTSSSSTEDPSTSIASTSSSTSSSTLSTTSSTSTEDPSTSIASTSSSTSSSTLSTTSSTSTEVSSTSTASTSSSTSSSTISSASSSPMSSSSAASLTLTSSSSSSSSPPNSTTTTSSSTSSISFVVGTTSVLSTLSQTTIATPIPVHNMTSIFFVSTLSTVTIPPSLTTTARSSGFFNTTTAPVTQTATANATRTSQPVSEQSTNAATSVLGIGSGKLSAMLLGVLGFAIVMAPY
ncbi:concanavalin A-like lectin/glucanase domain-containing protein [Lipomyces tetrasporus]|uniref:Concanavalin A-like lectin/glucanase domain-containing protein n=1 Tax=Lipomyces tetrasporus TaxID=54092 RepID=A0AAD7QN13_9ASCO|nr:concanavalin A-like lectin/glucanase domain-containing protein [Lipomyces tetrasporus]KAJ8098360.1 concanavalin A-like lectin/glucanase domain-containing protein [Lipomyces tetrasporus]